MTIPFKWKGKPPTSPSAESVQAGFEFTFDHLPDPRGLLPEVVVVHLSQDNLGLKINGVGWSKDDRRLITLSYSLVAPNVSTWDYYENPVRSQS